MRKACSMVCLGVFLAGVTTAQPLPKPLEKASAAMRIHQANVTVAIKDLTTHQWVLRVNTDKPTRPASTEKLITTSLALDTFGPDARYETKFYIDGPIEHGRIKALYIQGSGDPSLVVQNWYLIMSGLREAGIHEIDGPVVIDNQLFHVAKAQTDDFDGQGGRPYNLLPSAVLFNYQFLNIDLKVQDHNVLVSQASPIPGFTLPATLPLTTGACGAWRDKLGFSVNPQGQVRFSGALPRSCGDKTFNVVVPDTLTYGQAFWRGLWTQLGGTWHGSMTFGHVPEHAQWVYTYTSEPLFDIVKSTNKFSNNVMARHLFLSLDSSEVKTEQGAREAVKRMLAERNIPTDGLFMDNGSGLSRISHVKADTMMGLIDWAYHSRFAPEIMASLPVTGIDGTMRKRDVAPGWGRIKTGYLGDVRAIAGWIHAKNGHTYGVFATVVGYPDVTQGIAFLDQVMNWTYALPASNAMAHDQSPPTSSVKAH